MKLQNLLLPGLTLALVVGGCLRPRELPAVPLVVIGLKDTFEQVKLAAQEHDEERFFSLLDPSESTELRVLAQRHGYTSLTSYISYQFSNWPDLDTLRFQDLQTSGDYLRLSMSGPGQSLRRENQIRYTFLLFRNHPTGWKLAGMCSLENPGFDRYGNPMTVHETDLPPFLRFPRLF